LLGDRQIRIKLLQMPLGLRFLKEFIISSHGLEK
jgi:hypothetical protein